MMTNDEAKKLVEEFTEKLSAFIQKENPPMGIVLFSTLIIAGYSASWVLHEVREATKNMPNMSDADKENGKEYARKLEDLNTSIKQLLG